MISFLKEGKDEYEKRGNIWSVAEKGGKKGKEKNLYIYVKYLSSMNICSSVLVARHYVLNKVFLCHTW